MQITRYGSYGILVKDSALLLTEKAAGPYKGLWDLPGGAIERNNDLLVCEVKEDSGRLKRYCPPGGSIEFGEFAENALRREMLEDSITGPKTMIATF